MAVRPKKQIRAPRMPTVSAVTGSSLAQIIDLPMPVERFVRELQDNPPLNKNDIKDRARRFNATAMKASALAFELRYLRARTSHGADVFLAEPQSVGRIYEGLNKAFKKVLRGTRPPGHIFDVAADSFFRRCLGDGAARMLKIATLDLRAVLGDDPDRIITFGIACRLTGDYLLERTTVRNDSRERLVAWARAQEPPLSLVDLAKAIALREVIGEAEPESTADDLESATIDRTEKWIQLLNKNARAQRRKRTPGKTK